MSTGWWTHPLGTPVDPGGEAITATSRARVSAAWSRSDWPSMRLAQARSPGRVSPTTMRRLSSGALAPAPPTLPGAEAGGAGAVGQPVHALLQLAVGEHLVLEVDGRPPRPAALGVGVEQLA